MNKEKLFIVLALCAVAVLFITTSTCIPNIIREKFEKQIPIHEDNIFDESIIGEIPESVFQKIHVCEVFDGEPIMVSGIFLYDFDSEHWIYCQ